jgi:hypothetical protein
MRVDLVVHYEAAEFTSLSALMVLANAIPVGKSLSSNVLGFVDDQRRACEQTHNL